MSGPIDNIVSVTVAATGATAQLANFGTPAILCYHTHNGDYIRTYSGLNGLTTDGFATTDPAYLMATAILAQTPAPAQFKVIRGTSSVTQSCSFTVTDNTNGDSVGFTAVGVNGSVTKCYVTVSSQTTTQVATAIAALTAPNGVTLSSLNAVVTMATNSAGKIAYYYGIQGGTFLDNTPAASNNATDLGNALGVDPSFYTITGEHQDVNNIAAISSWAETNKKIHLVCTTDTNNTSASSGISNTLKTSAYNYSYTQFGGRQQDYAALALGAQRLTARPGSDTWAFKQLAGVAADSLTATQITNLQGNNCNYYTPIAGVNVTQTGINASGQYADLRRGLDALVNQIQVQVYNLLLAQPKVPFDPLGIAMMGAEVSSALQQYTASPNSPNALLRNDPGFQPSVILPSIASTTATDRSARTLKNVNFVAYAQNAVQTIQITGTVNT